MQSGSEEVTVAEAAELIGVNRQRIGQYVDDGRIRVVRWISRIRMLSKEDVLKVKNSDRTPGPKPKEEVPAPAPGRRKSKRSA